MGNLGKGSSTSRMEMLVENIEFAGIIYLRLGKDVILLPVSLLLKYRGRI